MKKSLGPFWSKQNVEAGARVAKAWKDYFQSATQAPTAATAVAPDARVAAARAQHETELLRYPNVVGIADGIRMRAGVPTGEKSVVVLVQRKVPLADLAESDVLPRQIDGVPIDVVEIGRVDALVS